MPHKFAMMYTVSMSYTCPVCGYDKLDHAPYENIDKVSPEEIEKATPPYEDSLGKASYGVCPKCGFEYGNDDNPGTAPGQSFAEYRAEWEQNGSKWFDETKKS
jgi:rubredoxin